MGNYGVWVKTRIAWSLMEEDTTIPRSASSQTFAIAHGFSAYEYPLEFSSVLGTNREGGSLFVVKGAGRVQAVNRGDDDCE